MKARSVTLRHRDVTLSGQSLRHAETHERALLRVCQEAVSNVIRHAEARRVKVSVSVDAERVQLRVADDGRGVAPGAPRGLGLASMERRLVELGGMLRLRARRPCGTVLLASVPRYDRDAG